MPDEKNAQAVKTMVAHRDRLHLFTFRDALPEGVVAMDPAGHTPGHTVFKVDSTLIIGDLFNGAAIQIADPAICTSFDMDKENTVRTRIFYLQYTKDHGLALTGMHFPDNQPE